MEEIYLRGFPKSTNLWGSFDLSCVQNQFLDADTPNYLQNHPPSWLYPLLMIYLQKLNIRIQYIPYIYPTKYPRSPRSRFPHAQATSACRSGASDPGDPLGCWEQHGFFLWKYHGQTMIRSVEITIISIYIYHIYIYHIYLISI